MGSLQEAVRVAEEVVVAAAAQENHQQVVEEEAALHFEGKVSTEVGAGTHIARIPPFSPGS